MNREEILAMARYITNELEKQKQIVALLEHAIFNIKYAATEEQKITHKAHIDASYQQCIDLLNLKRTYEESKLKRVGVIGK